MKVTSDFSSPKFTPVTFHVTVESRDELESLWHRLNIAPVELQSSIKGNQDEAKVHFHSYHEVQTPMLLWDAVDRVMEATK